MGDSQGFRAGRSVGLVMALTVLVAGLYGCGDDADPPAGSLATPSATDGSDGSATSSATAEPTASLSDEEQVEAAVRDYYEAMDVAIRTGDTAGLRDITDPDCACRQMIASIEELFDQHTTEGAGVKLERVEVSPVDGRVAGATTAMRSLPYSKVDVRVDVVERFSATYDQSYLSMLLGDDRVWRVREVTYLSRDPG